MADYRRNYEDRYERRVYEFAKSEQENDKINNRLVVVEINETLPVIELTDENTTVIETIENDTPAKSEVKNFLVDRDLKMDDRLTLVGMAKSIYTGNKVWFYYDKKYEDIIVIPNSMSFGTDDFIDAMANNLSYMKGMIIPGSRLTNGLNSNLSLPLNEADRVKVTETNRLNKTYTMLVNVPWLNANSLTKYALIKKGDDYYDNAVDAPLQFINLGTIKDLFKDDKQKLPVNLILNNGMNATFFQEVGNLQPTNVIIPLNF